MKPKLTVDRLIKEAQEFCVSESKRKNKELFGVTDGKAVGTHIEHKFKNHLKEKYQIIIGSSASGIDLPSDDIQTDIKVTSIKHLNRLALLKMQSRRFLDWDITCSFSFTIKMMIPKTKLRISIL